MSDSEDEDVVIQTQRVYRARTNMIFSVNQHFNQRFRMTAAQMEVVVNAVYTSLVRET